MPDKKLFIFLLIFICFSNNNLSQSPDFRHSNIIDAVRDSNYSEAISDLNSLRNSDPRLFSANNYDYLLARIYEKKNDLSNAAVNYQGVISRNSVLKEYALWHLSQVFRNSGNLFLERLQLQELCLIPRGSLLNDAAKKRLARSFYESGNFDSAIANLTSGEVEIDSGKSRKIPRDDLVLLGYSYLESGNDHKAREVFAELANNPPDPDRPDDFALAGARGLDRLDRGSEEAGNKVPALPPEEHLNRAGIYHFNRDFAAARPHFKAIADDYPPSEHTAAAMFQIGRGFDQEREYEQAVQWYQRLLYLFPSEKFAASALYQSASAYANLDKTDEAVSRYEKYISENPDAQNLPRAYLNIIDAYRDADNEPQALVRAEQTQEKFRGKPAEAVALFAQIRIRIALEDWSRALNDLNRLLEMEHLGRARIAGESNKQEAIFLRGYSLEKLGRTSEAVDAFLLVPDGLKSYYGWRANERINTIRSQPNQAELVRQKLSRQLSIAGQTLTSSNADEVRIAAQNGLRLGAGAEQVSNLIKRIKAANLLLKDYREIPGRKLIEFGRKKLTGRPAKMNEEARHQVIADELLFLGLYDEAAPELETALRKNINDPAGGLSDFPPDTAYTLAVFYNRGDIPAPAIRYIESIWKNVPDDYPITLIPAEQLKLLYPKPYETALLKYGTEKGVDPRFILSIMRQESRFQADVKSAAAARGLMQFISNTSEKMAAEMKITDFAQDDLYNPPTAILFGAHYLAKLFSDYPGLPAAVAASYNGGEDRMARWLKRSKSDDPDRFVSEIIFTQTKDYAYRVMANYRVYQILYDKNLDPAGERSTN